MHPRGRGDEGAVLIELALIAPFLFLILFAIVEFGYAYGQSLDVRHGARETSRLTAVNYRTSVVVGDAQTAQIAAAACDRMQIVGGSSGTTVAIAFVDNGASAKERGHFVSVEVRRPLKQITGFLNFALDNVVLTSQVETRLETDATFNATSSPIPCS